MSIILDIIIGGAAGAIAFGILCCCKVGGDADRETEE